MHISLMASTHTLRGSATHLRGVHDNVGSANRLASAMPPAAVRWEYMKQGGDVLGVGHRGGEAVGGHVSAVVGAVCGEQFGWHGDGVIQVATSRGTRRVHPG